VPAYPCLVAGHNIAPAPPNRTPSDAPFVSNEGQHGVSHDGAQHASAGGAPGQPDVPSGGQPGRSPLAHAEVRDVLAWLRLLVDPHDAAAVVRALARPPIELRQVELARVIQVARRRKVDLVLGLVAATESPQVPPEARERIQRFVQLHRSAVSQLDTLEPDAFLAHLIEQLGLRARPLLSPRRGAQHSAALEQLQQLAVELVRSTPRASARDLVQHLVAVVPDAQSEPSPLEPADQLHATLQLLREEVLDGVARIGGRLRELRLDTELDISHGVVRYLELLKVAALLQRPNGQSLSDALADVNARLLAAATPLQREILQTSTLDQTLLAGDRSAHPGDARHRAANERSRASAIAPREQHSLQPFLPHRGNGLALSASDIHTYRSCPLRYKFARVLRIPIEQTVHQRFGIVVHQVLERYHRQRGQTLAQMLSLLDACSRRAGFSDVQPLDRQLLDKARAALTRYHAQLQSQRSHPVWFERQFDFRLGPHHLRGRVDRVDRVDRLVEREDAAAVGADAAGVGVAGVPDRARVDVEREDAEYELIDYKTSRPKSAHQLQQDIQLSLYALAASEDWQLPSSRQAYYYVLDDLKVPVPHSQHDAQAVKDIVLHVGDGILAQQFEPTPSASVCSTCDYRIVCPAAAAG
jgi:CRISPR/Cas system-associated exonuclease Cas4 (RecB family)